MSIAHIFKGFGEPQTHLFRWIFDLDIFWKREKYSGIKQIFGNPPEAFVKKTDFVRTTQFCCTYMEWKANNNNFRKKQNLRLLQ